jgi:signal transduction histidine kinase
MAIGLAVMVAALAVLVALQYRWLADLERASTIARRAALQKYLEVTAKEIDYTYRSLAERVLNLPAGSFAPGSFHELPYLLAKKSREAEGIARLFVVSYHPDTYGLYSFDPEAVRLVPPAGDGEAVAVWAAISPWAVRAKKGVTVETSAPAVDERDPRHRIVLNPITDEDWKLVGLAGMVIDPDHFEHRVLPAAVAEGLALDPEGGALAVTVWDGRGRVVMGEEPAAGGKAGRDGGGERAVRTLSFVFTDWKLGLAEGQGSPEYWARANFLVNLGLSVALGLVLLGGTGLALRTAARAVKLSEMKNDFVSNVSHELRTPLSSIRVFGEFMRLGRVTDEAKVREYGEYIETESRRLTRLIDNILDFSSIESGRKVYQLEDSDLGEVVAETLKTFEVRLRHQGFRIYLEEPEAPLPRLAVDPGAIAQAVANLVDNAVKYSDGAHEVVVRLGRNRRWVTVAVQDFGIGISRDEQARIFERFHRVSTGAVHDVRGSGLGLSIVQHVAQAHGGRVTVESEPGRGSTFTLQLPVGRRAEERAAAGSPAAASGMPPAPEVS